ncbi:MAG TPA: TIGR02594 family protein [Pseudobdellovibrionaceae bacterium]|jgi:uncharacterized protein (TIGR02594 family)
MTLTFNKFEVPWLITALQEYGVQEIAGVKNNPRVIEYAAETSLAAKEDSVAWCASFVTWCLETCDYKSTKSARARSYLDYGIKLEKPIPGCIVVYDRGGGMGHVHFYLYSKDGKEYGCGGNQQDGVNVSGYDKARVLGYRWPMKA